MQRPNSSILDHVVRNKKPSYLPPKDVEHASSPSEPSKKTSKKPPALQEELPPTKQIKTSDNSCKLPSISKRTLDLVKDVKARRKARAEAHSPLPPTTSSLAIEPKPLALSDLPAEIRILPLLVEQIDSALNLFSLRKTAAFFPELRQMVEAASREVLPLQRLLSIIALGPLYSLDWAFDARQKEEVLTVAFSNPCQLSPFPYLLRAEIEARKQVFIERLLEFASSKNVAEQSLKEEGESWSIALPVAEVPARSNQVQAEPLASVLEKLGQVTKPAKVAEEPRPSVLDKLRAEGLIRQEKPADKCQMSSSEKVSSLRERLISKVKEKEEQAKKEKEFCADKFWKVDKAELIDFAGMIKIFYSIRKVKSMFFVKVVDYLEKNCSKIKSHSEIAESLKFLIQKAPEWLSIVDNSCGQILRMNEDVDIRNIEQLVNK